MDLQELRQKRKLFLDWKDIKPLREKLKNLPQADDIKINFSDTISLSGEISEHKKREIESLAKEMKPWRKGPFDLFGIFIDSEWRSYIKYNLLKPHVDLENKIVGDIGCNNAYYLFRMINERPKELIGFDPSPLFKTQFDFINFYAKTKIKYELLGIEHLPLYDKKFDTLFCLGVLYHRHNPIESLKYLQKALNKQGELFLDTFFISSDDEMVLSPKKTYSKIPNVHFVPSVKALQNWCEKAGFKDFEVLYTKKTDTYEQRKTEWIDGESLKDFLDKNDENRTVEGYEAPKRIYVKLTK